MENLSVILEILMIASFGASWPFNVMKSYKARTAKGKSALFLILIFAGYIVGIGSKIFNYVAFLNGEVDSFSWLKWLALAFYVLNCLMVGTDLVLYVRNKKLDAQREMEANNAN